ncbi:MAG: hypothetical protein JEY71_04075 [Sphaerochaeta sp.]|nr:hypothetical protein [Sphaerochaeta sp.]
MESPHQELASVFLRAGGESPLHTQSPEALQLMFDGQVPMPFFGQSWGD